MIAAIFSPEAEADLLAIADFIACENPDAARPNVSNDRSYARFIHVIEICSTVAIETQTK